MDNFKSVIVLVNQILLQSADFEKQSTFWIYHPRLSFQISLMAQDQYNWKSRYFNTKR